MASSFTTQKTKATPPAYFISYILTSSDRSEVMGSNGALLSSEESHSRWLETQVRVGSYDLDDTHKVGNSAPGQGSFGASVPIDNAPDVLRRAIWLSTDKQFRTASEALIKINTSKEAGDVDRLKVFANAETMEKWLEENDPEGVAFEYEVLE